jgi:paraquat-inducible protein B
VSNQIRPETPRTQAAIRRSSWPGWIWAIPIAALLLIGWWVARSFFRGGEDITISFDDVHGLKQSDASVEFRGMRVGKVSGMELSKDGKTIDVIVHIDESATKFLKTGTQFWLRGAELTFSDPSSLSAIISGPTLIMEAGSGQKTTHFVGLTHRPVTMASDSRKSTGSH